MVVSRKQTNSSLLFFPLSSPYLQQSGYTRCLDNSQTMVHGGCCEQCTSLQSQRVQRKETSWEDKKKHPLLLGSARPFYRHEAATWSQARQEFHVNYFQLPIQVFIGDTVQSVTPDTALSPYFQVNKHSKKLIYSGYYEHCQREHSPFPSPLKPRETQAV